MLKIFNVKGTQVPKVTDLPTVPQPLVILQANPLVQSKPFDHFHYSILRHIIFCKRQRESRQEKMTKMLFLKILSLPRKWKLVRKYFEMTQM